MSAIARFLSNLFSVPSQRELDEAYLNKSVDVYDLEHRMRQLDQRSARSQSGKLFSF